MENSAKLPIVAFVCATFLVVFTLASVAVHHSGDGTAGAGSPGADLAGQGRALYAQLGCRSCHSINGQAGVGPTLNGLYSTQVPLEGGHRW